MLPLVAQGGSLLLVPATSPKRRRQLSYEAHADLPCRGAVPATHDR